MEDKAMESSLTWNQKLRRDRIKKMKEFLQKKMIEFLQTIVVNKIDIPTVIKHFSQEFGVLERTVKDYLKDYLKDILRASQLKSKQTRKWGRKMGKAKICPHCGYYIYFPNPSLTLENCPLCKQKYREIELLQHK
jgi:rubrerythrin